MTEKWSLKVISLTLHFCSKSTWWLTHSGPSRTWSLWEEKMIATCRSALPISSSGCTALQIVVSTLLIFFFHCIWSVSLTWGDHWPFSEEKRIMTSRKCVFWSNCCTLQKKLGLQKPHLQPCTSALSAPDVRFKLAVLSIALDLFLYLIIGKLRKWSLQIQASAWAPLITFNGCRRCIQTTKTQPAGWFAKKAQPADLQNPDTLHFILCAHHNV